MTDLSATSPVSETGSPANAAPPWRPPPLRPQDFEPWRKGMLDWLKSQILTSIRDLAFIGDPKAPIPAAAAAAFTKFARDNIEEYADAAWEPMLRGYASECHPQPPAILESRAERMLAGSLGAALRAQHKAAGPLATVRLVIVKPYVACQLLWSHRPGCLWINETWKTADAAAAASAARVVSMLYGEAEPTIRPEVEAAIRGLDEGGPWQMQAKALAQLLIDMLERATAKVSR